MSQLGLLNKIETLIQPTITALGYELWGCTLLNAGKSSVLRIYIDVPATPTALNAAAESTSNNNDSTNVDAPARKNNVGLEDCRKISNAISAILDVENLMRGTYNLEVSSPGLDRPLFTEEQYRRFIGHKINVRLSTDEHGKKKLQGKLEAVEGAEIKLAITSNKNDEKDNKVINIPLASIEKANIIFWTVLELVRCNAMKNKEILLIVDSISNEKGMEKEPIFRAIEIALEAITAKHCGAETDIRIAINRKTGDYETFRRWTVVADGAPFTPNATLTEAKKDELSTDTSNIERHITLSKAQKIDPELNVGDIVEEPMEAVPLEFGRIAAQQARQIIMREIRLAERNEIIKRLKEQVNHLINGIVKKISRDSILLDMGENMEGTITKEELLPRETIHMGDRVRAILYDVKSDRNGTMLYLSRTRPEMLAELFKLEVPEIIEETIEIKGVARDAGSRSKMAVKTNDGRIDPVGACVGIRGSRVQAVSNELGGEKVDIILWDSDPAQLVVNAMAPAEISSIVVDENNHSMDIIVREEHLAQAIGRNGQNVRLASELTRWRLNVLTDKEAEKKSKKESAGTVEMLTSSLDVDAEVAELLIQEGFHSLEDVAYTQLKDLASIEGFDTEIAEALRDRARDILLQQALTSTDSLSAAVEPAKDLLEMEKMTRHLAYILANHDIITRNDLAECSVDDLEEIEELSEKKAAELIMIARKPWFAKEKQKNSTTSKF